MGNRRQTAADGTKFSCRWQTTDAILGGKKTRAKKIFQKNEPKSRDFPLYTLRALKIRFPPPKFG
jgi:hypothetical protein